MRFSSGRPTATNLRLSLSLAALLLVANGADGEEAREEPAASAEALMASLQKRYESILDLRASFEQESLIASLGRRTTSRGELVVKRPGRMRWAYVEPDRRVIVLDGDEIRIYSAPDAQLQIASLTAGALSPMALGFLLGRGDLRDSFDGERIEDAGRSETGLRLRPRDEGSFEYLELWLDPGTHQLRESVVVDLFGNRTRVRFADVVENAAVPDRSFAIDVPEGTEVIDLR